MKIYCIYCISLNDDGSDYAWKTNVKGEKYHLEGHVVGFISSLEEAKDIVENNKTDLVEFCYNYILIEEVEAGIPARSKAIQWYKATYDWPEKESLALTMRAAYDTLTITPVEKPSCFGSNHGFSMG